MRLISTYTGKQFTSSSLCLTIFSHTDYDNSSELDVSSHFFLPDPFQRALPATRTNSPQNNQFLNSIALTQFTALPDNVFGSE